MEMLNADIMGAAWRGNLSSNDTYLGVTPVLHKIK